MTPFKSFIDTHNRFRSLVLDMTDKFEEHAPWDVTSTEALLFDHEFAKACFGEIKEERWGSCDGCTKDLAYIVHLHYLVELPTTEERMKYYLEHAQSAR